MKRQESPYVNICPKNGHLTLTAPSAVIEAVHLYLGSC